MQDLVKWSLKDENRAIQDALTQVGELFSIWTEVQRDLNDHIKEFKNQFDMILEGAKQLDVAKTDLQTAEQQEGKIKKELKKAAKKATAEELRDMTNRLQEAEREKDIAQLEVVDRVREHEAVKMIRIKEGLFKVSEAYVDFAQKCDVIFCAQRDIALQIPDVQDKDIQDIKYTGWCKYYYVITYQSHLYRLTFQERVQRCKLLLEPRIRSRSFAGVSPPVVTRGGAQSRICLPRTRWPRLLTRFTMTWGTT